MSKEPRKTKAQSQDKSLPDLIPLGRVPTRPIRSSSRLDGQEPPVPTTLGSASLAISSISNQDVAALPPQKKVRISSSNSGTASPSTPPRMKAEDPSSLTHQRKPTPTFSASSTASPSSTSFSTLHFTPTGDLKHKGGASLWSFTQNVKLEQDTGASNLRQVDAEVHSTLSQSSWSEPPPVHRIRAALQYLKYNALKPDPVVTGGLMRLCKAMPDLFRDPTISTMMIQMLRPEFTHSFKIRTNGAVVFLVCALLHQAWDDIVDWPTDFVMAYLEDALGERSWCAHSDTKSFVQNVQTAFLTDDSTTDSLEGKLDSVRLDERSNSSAIMAAIDLNDFTGSLNTLMRYKSSSVRALIKQVTLQTIWDHVPAAIGASAVDATVRSLIKVMMATVRWTEVRLKAMGCMEFWLGNFTKNAKPLLRLILRHISQQDTLNSEDVRAWEMLLDFRYSGRAHQVESVKEEIRVALIGIQGQELIRIGLQHIMAMELNPTELKNPYHLDLMELLLQGIPDNSAVEFGKLVQTRIVEAALHLHGVPENLTAVPVVHVVKRWIKFLGKRGGSWIIDMVVGLLEDDSLYLPLAQKHERVLRHQSSPSMPTPLIWLRLLTEILCYIMLSTAIDARDPDDIRASKLAVSQAQVAILEWLSRTFAPSDQATHCRTSFGLVPVDNLRSCIARLLFLDPLMSYSIDTSTQEFDTTLIFKVIEGGLPIIEESLISLLGLPLPAHMILGLVGEFVSRAVEYSKVNPASLPINDATVIDKIYELSLFTDSPDTEVVERARAISLAWTSSFWACSLICVMIACCNPRTLGLVVWDTMPVLRMLLECSISQHYTFPPPNYTSTSNPSAESLVRRSMMLDQDDRTAVLQWEQVSQQQQEGRATDSLPPLDSTNSEYVGSLMVSDYRQSNHIRQPPPEVLNELRSLNERYGLGMKLASSRDPDYLGRMVGPNDDSAWVDKLLRDVPEILKALPASTLCARYCRTVEASSEMDVNWGEDSVSASAAVSGIVSTDSDLKKKLVGHVEAFMESVARYDTNSSVFADYLTRPQARYREVCDIFEFFLGRLALLASQQQSNSHVLTGDPRQVKTAMLLLFQGDNQWPHVLLQLTTKISNPSLTDRVIKWLEAIMLQDDSIAWITSCLQYLLQIDGLKTGQQGQSVIVEKSLHAISKVVIQRRFVWHWLIQHRPSLVKILGKRLEMLMIGHEHPVQDTDIEMDDHDVSSFSADKVVVQCSDGHLLSTTPEILRLCLLYLVQTGQQQGILYQRLCVGPTKLQGGEPLLHAQYPPEGDGDLRKELVKRTHDISIARIALEGMTPVQVLDLVRDLFGVDGSVAEVVMEALLRVLDDNQQELPQYLDPGATKTILVLVSQFAANPEHPSSAKALKILQDRMDRRQKTDGLAMDIENESVKTSKIVVPNFFLQPLGQ